PLKAAAWLMAKTPPSAAVRIVPWSVRTPLTTGVASGPAMVTSSTTGGGAGGVTGVVGAASGKVLELVVGAAPIPSTPASAPIDGFPVRPGEQAANSSRTTAADTAQRAGLGIARLWVRLGARRTSGMRSGSSLAVVSRTGGIAG